ncbi:MAG TPA: hypothetical protein VF786_05445 [Terriglobales bacterium]
MAERNPITSNDLAPMTSVVSQALQFALQALRYSASTAEVLIEKEIISRSELQETLRSTENSAKLLHAAIAFLAENGGSVTTVQLPSSDSVA